MADEKLTFLSWVQERIAGLATGQSDGRASCVTTVTLTGKRADGATTDTQARELRFLLAGPADVISLERRAVVRRYPAPGTLDHESDRCPYVELADPSLPWRYTPAPKPAAGTGNLHPWLVLVVGVEGTEITLNGDWVTIEPTAQVDAQALGEPTSAYRFAHVQVDAEGRRTARILSGRRPLEPGAEYIAVLVPAFDETGERRWTGAAAVTVPAYDSWRFRTAEPAGSFEDLAARLQELVAEALAHLGALAEARQRVRNLVMGVEASKSLWRRRVPADRLQRLWLLGPALPRLATDRGTVNDLATAEDRTLPRGVFSAAARHASPRPGSYRPARQSSTPGGGAGGD